MSPRPSLKIEKAADHEGVFLSNYSWLLERALSLVHGAKDEAEDLVQDLYVRFVLSGADVDLSDGARTQGYLLRALRNLYTDRHRSRERDPLRSLQTVDFDSMEMALAAVDRNRLLYIRSDLAGICEYACLRRKSSRVGSVLILRFFLAYFPSEIATLLKTSPIAVHKLIQTARLEAQAFLKRPGSLHLPGQDSRPRTSFAKCSLPDDPTALFARLHDRIFATAEGACLTADEFDSIYAEDETQPLTTKTITHLASCRTCLEGANHLLGFPDLSKRMIDDANDRDDRNSPPRSGGSGQQPIEKMRKKLRGVREHRPKTLEVTVDGRPRAAQEVTSPLSRFHIPLKGTSQPKYISVLSEQGHCLLYIDLEDHKLFEFAQLRKEITFSDQRSLVLEVNPSGTSSVIDLTYHDPALGADDESWTYDESLEAHFDEPEQDATPSPRGPWLIERLWTASVEWFTDGDNRLPASIAAAAILLSAVATLLIMFSPQERDSTRDLPSATALLARSDHSAQLAIPAGGAVHQIFALEIRGVDGKLFESRTVDTLRSSTPARRASRLIGPNHKLVAGRWTDSTGGVTTYSSVEGVQRSDSAASETAIAHEAWLHVPDAADFNRLIPDPSDIRVQPQQGGYELLYDEPKPAAPGSLVHADLVLSSDGLHATSETLRFKVGTLAREYRFQELTYEIVPANRVSERDFEPDPTLLSPSSGTGIASPIEGTSAHLALAALQLLDNLGPDVERGVNLERLNDGSVELNGVFPTTTERTAIVHVFRSLEDGSQLKLDFHANDETMTPAQTPRHIQVESLEPIAVDTQRIPFDLQIRPILEQQGLSGTELESRIHHISRTIITHSAQFHRESWTICQIAAHNFSPEELQALRPDDQVLWVALLERHLRTFDAELAAVHLELAPLWHDTRARFPDSPENLPSPSNTSELKDATIILNHDSERLDRLLTAGFTLSPSSLPANYNLTDVAQLISDLHYEEKTLRNTFDRLHSSRLAEARK